ncbi:hypothetical protein EYR40_010384 [Pleurotus pulmonarius]|nr:hypothetical protein EYR36_010225 [Pleurotus pulmonarius]KAF4588829.1 hypothetical protein EYR40_010384 [Pleurotus pulmonarius]
MSRSYLVVGGAGFLGSHIVQALVNHGGTSVAVYDLKAPLDEDRIAGVEYFTGDILDEYKLVDVLNQAKVDLVFHAASPVHGLDDDVYYKVNQRGTERVLSACRKAGVEKLVYTSSTGVVWTGVAFNGINEAKAVVPPKGYDAYHHTKALAERLVLAANDEEGPFQAVIIRPCGMTGERDSQLIWRLAKVLSDGQHHVQIGDNTNLVDYLYAGNAADAHVLAAERLFDVPQTVAGEAFFITNGSPMCQWDFSRMVWERLGDDGSKKVVVIPRSIGLVLATLAEFWSLITGTKTEFNRFSIRYVTATQWYDIDKARRLLGYEPKVSLEEGVRRTTLVSRIDVGNEST